MRSLGVSVAHRNALGEPVPENGSLNTDQDFLRASGDKPLNNDLILRGIGINVSRRINSILREDNDYLPQSICLCSGQVCDQFVKRFCGPLKVNIV